MAVVVRNVDTNIDRRAATDETGNYAIPNLPPGNHELSTEAAGFHKAVQKGIVPPVGQVLRTDIKLEVGWVTETVNVESSPVSINTENGTIKGAVIVQAKIQELPLAGRDFIDLAFFTPGVGPKVEGGRSDQHGAGSGIDSRICNLGPRGYAAWLAEQLDAAGGVQPQLLAATQSRRVHQRRLEGARLLRRAPL